MPQKKAARLKRIRSLNAVYSGLSRNRVRCAADGLGTVASGFITHKTCALPVTGLLTVGTMSVTNFQLNSDFKWLLLAPSLFWIAGLTVLIRNRGRDSGTSS